jgi:hypothetical protein
MKTYVNLYLIEFLEWEIIQTNVVQKIKTHVHSILFPPPENRAVYEIMWKNTVGSDRPQMKIQYEACSFRAG